MAIVTCSGEMLIDMTDVWVWIYKTLPGLSDFPADVCFSVEEEALRITQGDDVSYIEDTDFWTWIHNEQFPQGMADLEKVFGVPRVVGHEMKITFAAGDCTDPRNWSDRPKCLDEWEVARSGR